MPKPLSEQLADLSVRAKACEDSVTAAQKEAHDKIVRRKEQARTAAAAAIDKVNEEANSARTSAGKDWNSVKAKIASDMTALHCSGAGLVEPRSARIML
jgi:hypothetical protein